MLSSLPSSGTGIPRFFLSWIGLAVHRILPLLVSGSVPSASTCLKLPGEYMDPHILNWVLYYAGWPDGHCVFVSKQWYGCQYFGSFHFYARTNVTACSCMHGLYKTPKQNLNETRKLTVGESSHAAPRGSICISSRPDLTTN